MRILEHCFDYRNCSYVLAFDDHVVRKIPLSRGYCPTCEVAGVRNATVIYCPAQGCNKLHLTREFIRNYKCHYCEKPLAELYQRRIMQLKMERSLSLKLNWEAHLSPREAEIVGLFAKGLCNKEVAVALNISVNTTRQYRATIMAKLNAHSLLEIGQYAMHRILMSKFVE
jgi:DNA-binding CsgD family transcriptional regulator